MVIDHRQLLDEVPRQINNSFSSVVAKLLDKQFQSWMDTENIWEVETIICAYHDTYQIWKPIIMCACMCIST